MDRRGALALARAPSARPSLDVSALRRPSARSLAWVAAALAVLGLAYMAARETSLFGLREVRVAGAGPGVAADVRHALAGLDGESLVALDPDSVERRLRDVPTIRDARVDRAFPHALAVDVVPERPLAVVRDGKRAWLVAESGRVVAPIEPTARPRLARIRVELERTPAVGGHLETDEAQAALTVLRAVPRRFPARVLLARVEEGGIVLVVGPWVELRLGPAADLERKLAAAAAVLRSLPPEELEATGYVDASVPERVVAGAESQPGSES